MNVEIETNIKIEIDVTLQLPEVFWLLESADFRWLNRWLNRCRSLATPATSIKLRQYDIPFHNAEHSGETAC